MDSSSNSPKDAASPDTQKNAGTVWLELLKLTPQFAWILLAACLLLLFSKPLLHMLEQGRSMKIGVGVLQIEIAQAQLARAAAAKDQTIPNSLKARIERTPRELFDATVLWLDDNPVNNLSQRRALVSLRLIVDTATNTADAMTMLTHGHYDIIISDLHRVEKTQGSCANSENSEDRGDCDLISQLNRISDSESGGKEFEHTNPPVIFYAWNYIPSQGAPPYSFGATNRVDALFHLVLDALERRGTASETRRESVDS